MDEEGASRTLPDFWYERSWTRHRIKKRKMQKKVNAKTKSGTETSGLTRLYVGLNGLKAIEDALIVVVVGREMQAINHIIHPLSYSQ